MSSKYIFLDIDGTLVDYDAKMPSSALKAVKQARANGHKVFIASGRSCSMIYPELLEDNLFDGYIAAGGAYVSCGSEIIFQSFIEGKSLLNLVNYFRAWGIKGIAHRADGIYCEREFIDIVIPEMLRTGYSEDLIKKSYGRIVVIDDLSELKGIEKFSFYMAPKTTKQIFDDLGGEFYVVDFSVGDVKSDTFFGEINMSNVNKATAIDAVIKHFSVSVSDTIAFGDSRNDLEMIEFAAIGVAMGNATEIIKKAADFVTTNVSNDGIYNAFSKLGLI